MRASPEQAAAALVGRKLDLRAQEIMENRLDSLERDGSLSADEIDVIWCGLLPEGAPPKLLIGGRVCLTAKLRDTLRAVLGAADRRPDFSVSAGQWILIRQLLPESFPEPASPTDHLPGTSGKVAELQRRREAGLALWHEDDAVELPDHLAVANRIDGGECAPPEGRRSHVKKPRTSRASQPDLIDVRRHNPDVEGGAEEEDRPTLEGVLEKKTDPENWRARDGGEAAEESGCRRGRYRRE